MGRSDRIIIAILIDIKGLEMGLQKLIDQFLGIS
jgi:hypothetical protein